MVRNEEVARDCVLTKVVVQDRKANRDVDTCVSDPSADVHDSTVGRLGDGPRLAERNGRPGSRWEGCPLSYRALAVLFAPFWSMFILHVTASALPRLGT